MTATYDRPTTPNAQCGHEIAEHWHGTNACYTLDGCRCPDCRLAAKRYEVWRLRSTKPLMVDAYPVRRHVRALIAGGMGLKRIAEVSGVPHGSLWKLTYRWRHADGRKRMSRQVRRSTAERILATVLDVADGARVAGTEARAIHAELLARGWTKRAIAARIGQSEGNVLRNRDVSAGTLRALRPLLDERVPARTAKNGAKWTPVTGHQWQTIPPSTLGVPVAGVSSLSGAGVLACRVCERPLATHSIVERCA